MAWGDCLRQEWTVNRDVCMEQYSNPSLAWRKSMFENDDDDDDKDKRLLIAIIRCGHVHSFCVQPSL